MSKRISQRTREAAIELLRCAYDQESNLTTTMIADVDVGGDVYEVAFDARLHVAVAGVTSIHDALLEAAQLLEEGWTP